VARILLRQKHFGEQGMPTSLARGVCQPPLPLPPLLRCGGRGIKTGTALTPGCAPLSLTRGYNQVTPNGVSVCVPQLALELKAHFDF